MLDGIEAARRIRQAVPRAKLVRAEALGYVIKRAVASDVLNALHEALAGHFFVTRSLLEGLPEAPTRSEPQPGLFGSSLTPRQREVLQLVAEDKSAKEIAGILKISPKNVEFHKSVITDEPGMRTTAELTRFAVANGIVENWPSPPVS